MEQSDNNVVADAIARRNAQRRIRYQQQKEEILAKQRANYDPVARQATYDPAARSEAYRGIVKPKMTVAQRWDVENPCKYCGCEHLTSAVDAQRQKCCKRGKLCHHYYSSKGGISEEPMPQLVEIPEDLGWLYFDDVAIENLSSSSTAYNKIFCIARTGVENEPGGRYDTIYGTHSASIHGRVYTFLPSLSAANNHMTAITNFIFDSLDGIEAHGSVFLTARGTQNCIDEDIANYLFKIVTRINPYAKALKLLGSKIVNPVLNQADSEYKAIVSEPLMGRSVSVFANQFAGSKETIPSFEVGSGNF